MLTAGFYWIALVSAQLQALSPPEQSSTPLKIVPLDKQYIPVQRNNVTVAYKTAYFGTIQVGVQRQSFTVVFDTGSGHLILPSTRCREGGCSRQRRFDESASVSAIPISYDGARVPPGASGRDEVDIGYGTGRIVGDFVEETVCLHGSSEEGTAAVGGDSCTRMRVVLATQMTEKPFASFEFDGILGLGLAGLAVEPEFSFFRQMTQLGFGSGEARFGYFLSRHDSVPSEISFGGYDGRRAATALQWLPVHRAELGYWQLRIYGVIVGGRPLPMCEAGGCVGVVDTGTSMLGAPSRVVKELHRLLARRVPGDPSSVDCRDFPGPEIVFDLGGFNVTIGPEDYSRPMALRVVQSTASASPSQVLCRASILPLEDGLSLGPQAWIFGEPVLRRYYTAYDWSSEMIGFAQSAQPPQSPGSGRARHVVHGRPPDIPQIPANIIV
mmetsp:Transcript_20624/g.45167  ORF Transcript_20624/g.45167 Transcript_20624/m.45167 type:complete len:440 (+) Transcript_20624:118-1437(+)